MDSGDEESQDQRQEDSLNAMSDVDSEDTDDDDSSDDLSSSSYGDVSADDDDEEEESGREEPPILEADSETEDTASPISRLRKRTAQVPPPNAPPTQRPRVVSGPWGPGLTFDPKPEGFATPGLKFHLDFNCDGNSTPMEILKYFWPDELVHSICNETNRYCDQLKQSKPNTLLKWKELTPQEFWKFMGVSMLMGLVKKSNLKDYWSTNEILETPFFPKVMSRNRYLDILRCLHFVNQAAIPPNNRDRLVKFGDVLENVFTKFRKFVVAGEFLCVDESLMPFKGRLSFKQYVPSKRARFGIKFFVLVDCATKAVLKMIPYQGKGTAIIPALRHFGIGGSVVVSLLENDFLQKHHRIVCDNWFNTPQLAKYLLNRQTYCLGTLQKKRSGDLKGQMNKKLKKGQVECFTSGGVLVERWMDRREVLMINSFVKHDMLPSVSTNPNNDRNKPATVLLYNSKMGGVDDVDKVIKPNQTIRKSIKWYKKTFFHLWDLTVYNSFVGYKVLHPRSKRRIKEFLEITVKEIFQQNPTLPQNRRRPSTALLDTRLVGNHFPIQEVWTNGKKKKGPCCLCQSKGSRKMTSYKCDSCNKWLCVKGLSPCFKQHHLQRDVPNRRNSI